MSAIATLISSLSIDAPHAGGFLGYTQIPSNYLTHPISAVASNAEQLIFVFVFFFVSENFWYCLYCRFFSCSNPRVTSCGQSFLLFHLSNNEQWLRCWCVNSFAYSNRRVFIVRLSSYTTCSFDEFLKVIC